MTERTGNKTPCFKHEGKGYKKGCPDCFEKNKPITDEDILYEDGQMEDSWRERNAD